MDPTRPAHTRTLFDLLMLSDFGRANPTRVRELLARCAPSSTDEVRAPRQIANEAA